MSTVNLEEFIRNARNVESFELKPGSLLYIRIANTIPEIEVEAVLNHIKSLRPDLLVVISREDAISFETK